MTTLTKDDAERGAEEIARLRTRVDFLADNMRLVLLRSGEKHIKHHVSDVLQKLECDRRDDMPLAAARIREAQGRERGEVLPDWRVPEGYVLVPKEPTEAMWSQLARQIVFWNRGGDRMGSTLYRHLELIGMEPPEWLKQEIPNNNHVPPKGSVAVAIYKAMLAAAPPAPSAPSREPMTEAELTQRVEYIQGRVTEAHKAHMEGRRNGCEDALMDAIQALAALTEASRIGVVVTDDMVERANVAYETSVRDLYDQGKLGPVDLSDIRTKSMRAALHSALGQQKNT